MERRALRADLVERAEAWRWCSLWRRTSGTPEQKQLLGDWPVAYPKGWCKLVNQPQTEAELEAIRRCVARGHDANLLVGMVGINFANAAEILGSTQAGWRDADQQQFEPRGSNTSPRATRVMPVPPVVRFARFQIGHRAAEIPYASLSSQ